MMKSQRSDTEKNNLIEEDKRLFYLSMKLLNATKLLIIIQVQKLSSTKKYRKHKSNDKKMLLSKCAICGRKETRFIQKQEAVKY